MKTYKEWLRIQKGVVRKQNKRIAELESAKVGSIMIDLKGTDMQKDVIRKQSERIAELEATVEQMKCCGNCEYHIATMCGLNNDTEYGSDCCANWQPDGLIKEEREAK